MHNRIVLGLLALAASSTFAAPLPPAKEILDSVRLQQAQQELELQGQLREGPIVIPFRLTQTGPVIRYSFSKPDEALQLRLGDNDSRLEEISGDKLERIAPAQFDHKTPGTAGTYQYLALEFIYWPVP